MQTSSKAYRKLNIGTFLLKYNFPCIKKRKAKPNPDKRKPRKQRIYIYTKEET